MWLIFIICRNARHDDGVFERSGAHTWHGRCVRAWCLRAVAKYVHHDDTSETHESIDQRNVLMYLLFAVFVALNVCLFSSDSFGVYVIDVLSIWSLHLFSSLGLFDTVIVVIIKLTFAGNDQLVLVCTCVFWLSSCDKLPRYAFSFQHMYLLLSRSLTSLRTSWC